MANEQSECSFRNIKNTGIVTLIISQLFVFGGAIMKIQHYPYGSYTLVAGECLVAVAVGLFLYLLLKRKPVKGDI